MKRYCKFLIILLPALLFSAWACKDSFLDEKPVGALGDDEVATKSGAEVTLIGAYSVLDGQIASTNWNASEDNWVYGSVAGGDAHKGSNQGDQTEANQIERYEPSPTNGYFNAKWLGLYEGVARSNASINATSKLSSALITDDDKTRMLAEARFLRALYHFEAKKMWKNVPFVDETVSYGSNNYKIGNSEDIWPKIQADLEFAYKNIPGVHPAKQVGRVNKWAAGALLGKCLLYQKKYNEAKVVFTDVITNGTDPLGEKYALAPNYHFNFDANYENGNGYPGTESVFAVQASVNDGGGGSNSRFGDILNFPHSDAGGVPGGCCGFFQPSFDFVNSHRTDANGLPLLDGSYNTESNRVKNDMGITANQAFVPDASQSIDPRLDWTVGRRGIPYLDWGIHPGASWIRDQSNGGPFSPKKNVYNKEDAGKLTQNGYWTKGLVAINYNLIRFADVLLMAAECEVEAGDLTKALAYVNLVRERAAGSKIADAPANYVVKPYPSFPSKEYARSAVRFERKIELGMEGHRFFDLARWDVAKDDLPKYIEFEKIFLPGTMAGAKFDAGKDEYFPIPQAQIDLTGKDASGKVLLQQN